MQRISSCGGIARVPLSVLLCWASLGALAEPANAQQTGLAVLVDQIAGANVYIRAGTDDGITVNDTLFVYDEAVERYLGALLVVSATSTRAVVTFASEPFSVTRGTTLFVTGSGTPVESPEPTGLATQVERPRNTPGYGPQVSGRLSMEFNALETTTRWLSNEENSVGRTFATPAVGLRMAVSHLPGDLEFTTNLRGAYRYSSTDLVDPAQSVRIYELSLARSFSSVPFQFQAGRFYNRYETFSGYFDGLLLHYGGRGPGFGIVAGFEPDRANEEFSTALPKYTAFADFNHVGESVSYYTDVSFHHMKPDSGLASRTFLGWSQRLTVGRTRFASDLQVDRDSETDTWAVTRLHASASVPIAGRLSLHARYALDDPQLQLYGISLLSLRRHQGNAGISYWARGGSFNLDITGNRVADRDITYTLSGSFNLRETSILGLGFNGAGSYWSFDNTKAVNLAGGIHRRFGRVQTRAGYQLYRTESSVTTFSTHSFDLGFVLPLARRVYSTVQARLQRGENQTANSIFVNLWMSF